VEKPLATSWKQYAALSTALESGGERRLFACFHKRYSRLNDWARSDLGVDPGEPVDMHCIVFEIPLPFLHWYNWPNSGSRIISNGCHWLDYFLFMNDYCQVVDAGVWAVSEPDVAAFVELDNGAKLVMSLTDTGSARLGVRDVIELRAGNVTVRLTDATYYDAENTAKVLRRRRENPMSAYRRMYRTICRRIAKGKPGDDLSTLCSSKLMLQIEDELRAKRLAP
jgi:predicted dehydrogenase